MTTLGAKRNVVVAHSRHAPKRDTFMDDVIEGLSRPRKELSCKYFYDERGSALFDEICDLEAYYPTRTELGIMRECSRQMAEQVGPEALLVEYGSGSSRKTHHLLDVLEDPVAYVPLDISGEHLRRSAQAISDAYPALEVLPFCADYTQPFELPAPARKPQRTVVYFPGSTIGNFHPHEAVEFMSRIGDVIGSGGGLLIGVDLHKDTATLERAYDDDLGVTAEFNKNLLARINRELGGTFALQRFRHRARYDERQRRIEMRLESLQDQIVRVAHRQFTFRAGESIVTEYSYKYTRENFAALARDAGLAVERVWTDERDRFSVQMLSSARSR